MPDARISPPSSRPRSRPNAAAKASRCPAPRANAGFTIGPPLGGLLAAYDFSLVFVIDAVTSLVMAAIIWRWVPNARRTSGLSTTGLWTAVLKDRPVLMVLATIVVVDTVYRQIFATMPLLLRDAGSPAVAYGVLIGAELGRSSSSSRRRSPYASRATVRPARDRGRLRAASASGSAVLGVWPALAGAALAIVVITAGEMLYKPTATAHVADAAPAGMVGRYSSLYAAASISGMFLAPAIGGTTYQHAPRLLYPVAAGLALAAGAVLLLTRAKARDVLPSESTARPSSGS